MAAQKMFETLVTVEGAGAFPIDMLRYDTCFPATEQDSHKIGTHYDSPRRTVVLRRRGGPIATVARDRWQSFGWTVKEVMHVK